jgi:hypothetical protein
MSRVLDARSFPILIISSERAVVATAQPADG